jgi:nucleoside-diphosphate-sugar epimerase
VQAYEKSNFPVTIIRPTYIYGPNNNKYREKYFFDRISAKKNLFILYPGNAYVDLVHVDDVASLCVECLQNSKSIGEIYNASGGELTSGELLAKLVGNIIGIEPNIVYYKDDDLKKARWPENKRLYPFTSKGIKCISNQKAIHQLGWTPQIRLREGIKQCYKTYIENGFEEINWNDEEKLFNAILNG